jgi:hypothetical protein
MNQSQSKQSDKPIVNEYSSEVFKRKKTQDPDAATLPSQRSIQSKASVYSNRDVQSAFEDLTLEERKQHFGTFYGLLRVKTKSELRFSKKTKQELKRKFLKHSKLGINQQSFKQSTNEQPINDLTDRSARTRATSVGGPVNVMAHVTPQHIKKMQSVRLMHKEQFRLFFGLLGQGSNPFISDRIFKIADTDQDQHINFEEFLTIIDIYQNGSVEEKNEFSFALFDENFDGEMCFDDMYKVMKKFVSNWSTL